MTRSHCILLLFNNLTEISCTIFNWNYLSTLNSEGVEPLFMRIIFKVSYIEKMCFLVMVLENQECTCSVWQDFKLWHLPVTIVRLFHIALYILKMWSSIYFLDLIYQHGYLNLSYLKINPNYFRYGDCSAQDRGCLPFWSTWSHSCFVKEFVDTKPLF